MGGNSLFKAKKLGLFKTRSLSEAGKISALIKPRDYSNIRLLRPALVNYRSDCSFKFNLADYPSEFDFTLIEQFGWYRAKNRGDNPNGISRDHLVSVKYGFDNNIDPKIISHPANCQLIRHNENVSKGIKCKISLEQLLEKINYWNNKYSTLVKA